MCKGTWFVHVEPTEADEISSFRTAAILLNHYYISIACGDALS
jgi:hypothetical protein